jgi:uncharacterized protein YggE
LAVAWWRVPAQSGGSHLKEMTLMHASRLAAIALALGLPTAVVAQVSAGPPEPTTLDVSAVGEAKAEPDTATLTLAAQSVAPRASDAVAANAARMAAVLAALRRAGVAAHDLQTSGFSLEAQYAYEQGQPPRLTGYQASSELTVTVRDFTSLGPLIDAAVAAGATSIASVAFGLANPVSAQDSARLAAVKAIEDKAALYARETGYHIVRLINLTEGAPTPLPYRPMALQAKRAMAPTSTPIAAGETTVQVEVSAEFELAR